jgi:exopolysaccharide biosynthesis polyprenyl glycosylphosphotransferase
MIRLFRVSIPASVLALVLSDTILIVACYVGAALFALNSELDPWFYMRYDNGWLQVAFAVAIVQVGFYFMDMYDDLRIRSRILLIHQLFLLLGISFLIQALLGYSKSTLLQLPQWTMFYGSGLVLILVPAWRSIFFSLVRKALPDSKLLFAGMPASAQEITDYLAQRPDTGFSVEGYLDDSPVYGGARYLGKPEELTRVLKAERPDLVVVDRIREDSNSELGQRLLDVRGSGVKIESTNELYEMVFGRVSLRDLTPAHILWDQSRMRELNLYLQTIYSFVLAILGLIVLLPVMAIVAMLVKVTSAGPALYKQKRVGLNGQPFYLYKFRSMYIDAEAGTGPVWATKNDPRITPLGRWLRKLRLDELPQFFNVIRGEMALAGPRPERPEFCAVLEKEIPFYHLRHSVKPGITGWAQINHRYTETIEDTGVKLEYDLYYVRHLAPSLDAYIIFHTLKVMLLTRGAQ